MAKEKKVSAALAAALKKMKDAKSDQEKTAARSALKGIKFKEIGGARTQKTLSAIENLGKLANKNSYTWEDTHTSKIFTALQNALDAAKKRFETPNSSGGSGFTL